jgi:hypothetical protein
VPLNQGKHFAQKYCFHRLWCCHLSAQSLASEVHGLPKHGNEKRTRQAAAMKERGEQSTDVGCKRHNRYLVNVVVYIICIICISTHESNQLLRTQNVENPQNSSRPNKDCLPKTETVDYSFYLWIGKTYQNKFLICYLGSCDLAAQQILLLYLRQVCQKGRTRKVLKKLFYTKVDGICYILVGVTLL